MPAVLLSLNSSPPTFLKRWFQYPNNLVHILFGAYRLVTGIFTLYARIQLFIMLSTNLVIFCALNLWFIFVYGLSRKKLKNTSYHRRILCKRHRAF